MDFVFSLLLQTALVPIVVSVIVAALVARVSRIAAASGAISVAAGFFAGWAQQEWTTLLPTRYLDWLPWVALALAIVAACYAFGFSRKMLLPLTAAVCFGAAWLLVPSFPKLQPPRPIAFVMIATISILFLGPLEHSAMRINTRWLTVCLMATGTAGSVVLAQSFALKFAQIAGMLTAALAGSLLLGKSESERSSVGLQLVFVTMLTNLMFIGYASSSSDVPVYSYALIALAPLALWAAFRKSSEDRSHRQRLIAGGIGVSVILLLAVVPAVLAHPPWELE